MSVTFCQYLATELDEPWTKRSRCKRTNATNFFLPFNTSMSCVAVFLTLIFLPRHFKLACVLSIFARHQNSRLADARGPGWRPRLKSFLRRQTSRAASPIAAVLPLSPAVQIKQRKLSLAGCVAHRLVHSTGRTGPVYRVCQLACFDLFHVDSHNFWGRLSGHISRAVLGSAPGSQTHN